jgi:hypothetical protein
VKTLGRPSIPYKLSGSITKLIAPGDRYRLGVLNLQELKDQRGKLGTMAQIEICVVKRERMKRSSRCTDQLSKSMDESCGIKDLRWGIA